MNLQVLPENCIPTVGVMHGNFLSLSIVGRRKLEADTILYLDPEFPVDKLQVKFFGLKSESNDVYDF